jgi:hypothetical protein
MTARSTARAEAETVTTSRRVTQVASVWSRQQLHFATVRLLAGWAQRSGQA